MFSPSNIKVSKMKYFTFYNKKNSGMPVFNKDLHSHSEYEFFILLDGSLTVDLEDKTLQVNPVQNIQIPPGVKHRFVLNKDDSQKILLRGISIKFNFNSSPDSLFGSVFNSPKIINVTACPEIITLIHNITHYTYILSKNEFIFVRHGFLCQLFVLLYRYLSTETFGGKIKVSHITTHIIAYINQNLTKVTPAGVAKHIGFNEGYLNRTFKKDCGTSIVSYIQQRKILLAKTLIFGGEKPQQAMLKSGFTDYPNFYRLFKKTYGTSPRQMYEKYHKENPAHPLIDTV